MRTLLFDAAERAARYLADLDERAVAPTPDAVARLSAFEQPLPDGPTDPAEMLAELDAIGSPATMAMAGPRFFGFVIGGALPATVAANWLATAWDQNSGLVAVTPGTAKLEDVAIGWLLDILRLPPHSGVGFVTAATTANFSALLAVPKEKNINGTTQNCQRSDY